MVSARSERMKVAALCSFVNCSAEYVLLLLFALHLPVHQADIMYLFSEGHLVDFSSTELSKLVRALFADSQLRQRNLDTIARGR